VAEALGYAHDQQVVHRDIKPANIMLMTNDQVRVADFGIARVISSSKTHTGVIFGTPSYMSPEQVAGKKVDGRSDLFSLGIVFYEMLTGTFCMPCQIQNTCRSRKQRRKPLPAVFGSSSECSPKAYPNGINPPPRLLRISSLAGMPFPDNRPKLLKITSLFRGQKPEDR
jgi:serine/threonine protein kinase